MSKRPLDNISYQQIVAARAGSRASTADIPCPVCGPQHEGASARRKVLRTWTLGGDRISLHCARCGLKGGSGPRAAGLEVGIQPLPRSVASMPPTSASDSAASRDWRPRHGKKRSASKAPPARLTSPSAALILAAAPPAARNGITRRARGSISRPSRPTARTANPIMTYASWR